MKWHRLTRETGLIEWVCEHGIGHPDADSCVHVARVMAERYPDGGHTADVWSVHGCDGCCCRDDFPGYFKGNGVEPE